MTQSTVRLRRVLALLVVLVLLAAACSGDNDGSTADASGGGDGTSPLPQSALDAMAIAPFETARWSLRVEPLGDDQAVYALDAGKVAAMGSNTKLFTVGTWLDVLGTDTRLETPVYGLGSAADGTLGGDLVFRASGDVVMGGRNAGSGELGYSVPPQPDANGLPGAKPAPGNPLAGLDELAAQVADAGITTIGGNVVIDDRLFEPWTTSGDVVISPIVINDNLLAVVTTPGAEGEPAETTVIPETQAFVVENQVQTTAAGGDTSVELEPEMDAAGNPTDVLVVSGTIAADADPLLNVYDVPDPASYARTLFIEALGRAGVTTSADPTATNSTDGLPAFDSYTAEQQIASIESPPLQEIATLIWKISFNYGANLAACLLAVNDGSTDCVDGLDVVRSHIDDRGIDAADVWIIDGAGAPPSSTTPDAIVTWIQWLHTLEWGDDLDKMLPILGVDGSLSLAETDSPSTGKVQGKSGTAATVDPATGRLLMSAQAIAGIFETDDGDTYVFGVYMNNGSFETPSDIIQSLGDVAAVVAALQQSL